MAFACHALLVDWMHTPDIAEQDAAVPPVQLLPASLLNERQNSCNRHQHCAVLSEPACHNACSMAVTLCRFMKPGKQLLTCKATALHLSRRG